MGRKKLKKATDLHLSLMHTHAWIKDEADLNHVDVPKGANIFLHNSTGSSYGTLITTAPENVMDMASVTYIEALLNKLAKLVSPHRT